MDDDPFIIEARKHMSEANRMGRMALQAFLSAIGAFVVYIWAIDQSWSWLLWLASVVMFVRMLFALECRWFHRKAARIAVEFFAYSRRRC